MKWWRDAYLLVVAQLIACAGAFVPPEMTYPAGPTKLLVVSTLACVGLAIMAYLEEKRFNERLNMGHEHLASSLEELENLARMLRRRVLEAGTRRDAIEAELIDVDKRIEAVKSAEKKA